jgi:hypothetical protein
VKPIKPVEFYNYNEGTEKSIGKELLAISLHPLERWSFRSLGQGHGGGVFPRLEEDS